MTDSFFWKCPYCERDTTITKSNYSKNHHQFGKGNREGLLDLVTTAIICPNDKCREFAIIAELYRGIDNDQFPWNEYSRSSFSLEDKPLMQWKIKPDSTYRKYPSYIPEAIRIDYEEACKILSLSPKASATLSRRSLQGMIRDFWGISKGRLVDEIDAIKGNVDPVTWDAIDALRKVGNIGAHMEKDINLIIDVEAGEAEALIQLIETLMQEWYINRYERELRMKKIKAISDTKNMARKTTPSTP